MLRGERARRRRALIGLFVAFAVLDCAPAFVALNEDGAADSPAVAMPFHPVAGKFVPDGTRLDACEGSYGCLEQAFGNIAFAEGPKRALELFDAELLRDDDVEADCHRIAHTIGSAALERFDGDVATTFAQGSPACVSGYYHGILERAFLGISTKTGLQRAAKALCVADGIRRRGFLDYQCRHGLGHGLMIQTGYALPLALSVCAELGTGWDHKACASGVFMENVNTQFGFRSPWLDDEDPLYPCGAVSAVDRRSCYLRASWRILASQKGSFTDAAAACERLGTRSRTCFHGLGRDAAERVRYAPKKIRALCRQAGAREGDCLYGAARTVANASGRTGVEAAGRLCAAGPARHRKSCYAGLGVVVGMLHATPSARRAACVRVAGSFAAACATRAEHEVDPSGRDAWG